MPKLSKSKICLQVLHFCLYNFIYCSFTFKKGTNSTSQPRRSWPFHLQMAWWYACSTNCCCYGIMYVILSKGKLERCGNTYHSLTQLKKLLFLYYGLCSRTSAKKGMHSICFSVSVLCTFYFKPWFLWETFASTPGSTYVWTEPINQILQSFNPLNTHMYMICYRYCKDPFVTRKLFGVDYFWFALYTYEHF